jgi:hypothetical protein
LYFQAGKAIVYRPSTRQIVNMGPLAQPPAQVFIRNGSDKPVPESLAAKLTQPAGFNIVSQDNSPKPKYTKTIVVDVNSNRPDLAARLAKLIGAEVGKLPSGESQPEADLLVIVGNDAR